MRSARRGSGRNMRAARLFRVLLAVSVVLSLLLVVSGECRGEGVPGNRGAGEPGIRSAGELGFQGSGVPGNQGAGDPGCGET